MKHSRNYSLTYTKSEHSDINISAYADADFANDLSDRKSVSGYIVKINENTVAWRSKKQCTVSLSSAEAEYYALSDCISECIFVKQFLEHLSIPIENFTVFEDNQACVKIASTFQTKRTKHVDVKHHFLRQHVLSGLVKLKYLPSECQLADGMTKALPSPSFHKFREKLGLIDLVVKHS